MRLDFVGVDPGNPTDECPAVFVDRDTGDFYMQGETVTDPETLAWINSDSRILDTESVVRLPARMAQIILEAASGDYERGKRRFAPGEHPGGANDGPVLVTVADDRIVGALGPLATTTDANGTRLQTPQYFAVHPDYRGKGHGRALWRASMDWGHANGARYKVLQAASGSPAERLYLSESLRTLGFQCSTA